VASGPRVVRSQSGEARRSRRRTPRYVCCAAGCCTQLEQLGSDRHFSALRSSVRQKTAMRDCLVGLTGGCTSPFTLLIKRSQCVSSVRESPPGHNNKAPTSVFASILTMSCAK
jgi:hypothetical protein